MQRLPDKQIWFPRVNAEEQLHHIKVLIMHVFKEKEKKVEEKQHRSDEIFSYDIINKRASHRNSLR